MEDEYIIINKTAIQKRIEELEKQRNSEHKKGHDKSALRYENTILELKQILFQSTDLIPELQKTWNAAYIDALSIDEETYKPLFFEDYISNLKLDI